MEKDLVSIIMPTYNREKTIKRALDSLLSQTYSNIEMIIIDDGSSDNTNEIINSYTDKRINYIKLTKNMGANYARNYGISVAKGKYITFQDSDDEADINKIEDLVNFTNNNSCDIVFCNVRVKKKNKYKVLIKKQINENEVLEKLLWGNFISIEGLFLKRSILKDITFDDNLLRFQDWDLIIRLAQKYSIKHYHKELTTVYVQNDSITRDNSKGIKALKQILQKYDNLFNKKQKAKIYCRIGMFYARNNENANDWFKKAYKNDFKFSYIALYILNKLKLISVLYSIKENI